MWFRRRGTPPRSHRSQPVRFERDPKVTLCEDCLACSADWIVADYAGMATSDCGPCDGCGLLPEETY